SMGLVTPVWRYSHTVPPSSNERSTSPTKDDHIEIWATSLNLANTKDNWYRATQGVYVFSRTDNNKRHLGDEIDIIWTRFFMDGKLSFLPVGISMRTWAPAPVNTGPMSSSGQISKEKARGIGQGARGSFWSPKERKPRWGSSQRSFLFASLSAGCQNVSLHVIDWWFSLNVQDLLFQNLKVKANRLWKNHFSTAEPQGLQV